MSQVLLDICVVLVSLTLCKGYPSGVPQAACGSMMPSHGASAQTSAAPYTITVNTTTYNRGDIIEVTLTATSPQDRFFEGFILQARTSDSNTNAMGVFAQAAVDVEMRIIKCPDGNANDNAVTHTTASHKTEKKLLWRNDVGGDVFFQATFVNHEATFWTGIKSGTLKDNTPTVTTTVKDNTPTVITTVKDNTPTVTTTVKDNTPTVITTVKDNTPTVITTVKDNTPTVITTVKDNTPTVMPSAAATVALSGWMLLGLILLCVFLRTDVLGGNRQVAKNVKMRLFRAILSNNLLNSMVQIGNFITD